MHIKSKLIKKAAEEASGKKVMQKLHIGNIFLTTRKVSTDEPAKRELS